MNKLRRIYLTVIVAVLSVSGCSKKEAAKIAVPKPPQAEAKSPEATPDAAPPAPSIVTAPADSGSTLANTGVPSPEDADLLRFVQGKVESFLNGQGRNPTSLEELIRFKYLTAIPEAPAGKKFVFDKDTSSVKLVNQ